MEFVHCTHQEGGSGQKSRVGGDLQCQKILFSVPKLNNGVPKTATELSN